MRDRKFLPALTGVIAVIAIVLYVTFHFIFVDFFVDLWWFQSLNFEAYFWLKTLYRFIFSGAVTAFFSAVFLFHFWIASRYLDSNRSTEGLIEHQTSPGLQHVARLFVSGYTKLYIPMSLLLAIAIAIPFYLQWEQALLFFFGSDSGLVDPLYQNDVSFYLFRYPIYILVQKQLLISTTVALAMTGIFYWLNDVVASREKRKFAQGAKAHLCVLFMFVALFVIWGYMLDRYSLLYSDTNEPVFFGPGFVELRYELPLIWLSILAIFGTAAAIVFYVFSEKHRSKTPISIGLLFFILALWLKHFDAIPHLINEVIVEPNFSRIEAEAMRDNIDATLEAYGLNHIKTIDFKVNIDATKDIEEWSSRKQFENIPVWDREYLLDSYKQLQGIRPYYDFMSVGEDRYFINGHYQQVNIAAREIDIKKLPPEAQNWENNHLRYTHGYGAVVSPTAQEAGKPIAWYLRDLNLTSDVNFTVKYPDIYYGQEQYLYAIVPNILPVKDISGTTPNELSEYHGHSGIPISSYFKKILLASYLKDEKIFLSPNITEDSKLLLRRNIKERISTLTPFLQLDKDPYLVVGKDRFYWIQDAYTVSNFYPLSKPTVNHHPDGKQKFNYIRNSVKIVVDAYDGDVDYYISDPEDPVINAYNRAYPGVFKNLPEMPDELHQHLRYPRDLYYVQMEIYAKYHQNSPELFYEQAETRQFASLDDQPLLPYYITLNFNHCSDAEEFAMISPMSPVNRENLSMVGVASTLDEEKCGPTYQPGITIYRFPKAVQVNGPSQVSALIDQKPEIATQFNLWSQQGAKVKKGRMVILPMNNSILYVQPIYMLAKQTQIPELVRVIVSIGDQVVMEKTLQAAFDHLKDIFIKNGVSQNSN